MRGIRRVCPRRCSQESPPLGDTGKTRAGGLSEASTDPGERAGCCRALKHGWSAFRKVEDEEEDGVQNEFQVGPSL